MFPTVFWDFCLCGSRKFQNLCNSYSSKRRFVGRTYNSDIQESRFAYKTKNAAATPKDAAPGQNLAAPAPRFRLRLHFGSGSENFFERYKRSKSFLWFNFYQFLDFIEIQFRICQFWNKNWNFEIFRKSKIEISKKLSKYLHLVRSRSRPNFLAPAPDPAPTKTGRLRIPVYTLARRFESFANQQRILVSRFAKEKASQQLHRNCRFDS